MKRRRLVLRTENLGPGYREELTFTGKDLKAVFDFARKHGQPVKLNVTRVRMLFSEHEPPVAQKPVADRVLSEMEPTSLVVCFAKHWPIRKRGPSPSPPVFQVDLQIPDAIAATLCEEGAKLVIVVTDTTIEVIPHPPPPRRPRQPKAGA